MVKIHTSTQPFINLLTKRLLDCSQVGKCKETFILQQYQDAQAAYSSDSFLQPTCVIVKHSNPCGVASQDDLTQAYQAAFNADQTSAFAEFWLLTAHSHKTRHAGVGQSICGSNPRT